MTSPELGNILITGGASGLGAATVKAVRRHGGTPLVIDVNPLPPELGEGIAFFSPYPIGFWVTTFAFGLFVLATVYRNAVDAYGRRRVAPVAVAAQGAA